MKFQILVIATAAAAPSVLVAAFAPNLHSVGRFSSASGTFVTVIIFACRRRWMFLLVILQPFPSHTTLNVSLLHVPI